MIDSPKHYLAKIKNLNRAKKLRANMTDEEIYLWQELRQFRKQGIRFRRQAPIGPYVVDFLCRPHMLIIELDGEHHASGEQKDHDLKRDEWLRSQGYIILRIWNAEIRENLDGVVGEILNQIQVKEGEV